MPKVRFIRHRTLAGIYAAAAEVFGKEDPDILALATQLGVWGFCVYRRGAGKSSHRTVHYWRHSKSTKQDVLLLLLHELGHTLGTPAITEDREEERADTYAGAYVAAEAHLSKARTKAKK